MTIWSDSLDNIYSSEIAVSATLTPGAGSSNGDTISVVLIDKTSGIEVIDQNGLQTIIPVAFLRMSTLESNNLVRSDMDGGSVVINSKTWKINAHTLKPNPDGELKGEIVLMLIDENT